MPLMRRTCLRHPHPRAHRGTETAHCAAPAGWCFGDFCYPPPHAPQSVSLRGACALWVQPPLPPLALPPLLPRRPPASASPNKTGKTVRSPVRKWNEQDRSVHAPLIERASLTFWQAYLKGDAVARQELTGPTFKNAVGANGEWFAK